MSLRKFLFAVIVVSALVCPAGVLANVIHVPGDWPTIQDGIDGAFDGDTILVAPGTYGTFDYAGREIKIIGEQGPEQTLLIIPFDSPIRIASKEGPGTELRGFSISKDTATTHDNFLMEISRDARPTVTGCVFYRYNTAWYGAGIRVSSGAKATITYNIFHGLEGFECIRVSDSNTNAIILNNTFDHNAKGISIYDGTVVAKNNIFSNFRSHSAIGAGFELFDYNNLWNNGYDFVIPGPHGISEDPLYVDPENGDYSLQANSPCLNAGDINPRHNDPDGTRNDMGAVPSPTLSYPYAANFNCGPGVLDSAVRTLAPPFYWSYTDTSLTNQAGYEIEVGIDRDWTVAEMWATGPAYMSSGDTCAVYAGFPLDDNTTYYVRIRVSDGVTWGSWRIGYFHTRTKSIIEVPGEQPTIQAGIDAAQYGDTVLVGPGTYAEAIIISDRNVFILADQGPDVTFLHTRDSGLSILETWNVFNTGINGFTVSGGDVNQLILVGKYSHLSIEHCIFRDYEGNGSEGDDLRDYACEEGVSSVIRVQSNVKAHRNFFYNNGGQGCFWADTGATVSIVNNTFYMNYNGVYSQSDQGVVKNNIVAHSFTFGIRGLFMERDYNCMWNNPRHFAFEDRTEAPPGPNDMIQDPKFISARTLDMRLMPESPCIDAGDPGEVYNDPDSSRNDMGFLPARFDYPVTGDFSFDPDVVGNVLIHLEPMFSWSYLDTAGTQQERFEIEVGTDNDWTDAEMWATGQIVSPVMQLAYDGEPLSDQRAYVVRIRVHNGDHWGEWLSRSFRIDIVETTSDWTQHQYNAVHTGYNPEDRIRPPLEYRWSRKLALGNLSQIAVVGDKLLVTHWYTYNRSDPHVWCLDANTGDLTWSRAFEDGSYTNPPSYGYGRAYIQVVAANSYLYALDLNTGYEYGRAYYRDQWDVGLAPVVYDGKVIIAGFTYGGIQAFDAFTGALLWKERLGTGLMRGYTTAAYDNRVYAYIWGLLTTHDANSGEILWMMELNGLDPLYNTIRVRYTSPVIDSVRKIVYCTSYESFHAVDIERQALLWERRGGLFGNTPALYDGNLYIIHDGALKVLDGLTGDSLWAFTCPEKIYDYITYFYYDPDPRPTQYCPVISNGYVFVSSYNNIYAIDLETHELVWSYPVGGFLTVGHEQLYVAALNGTVFMFGNGPTAVEDESEPVLPDEFALWQNYPNPFNLSTRINYNLSRASQVTLIVYNILGQKVKVLQSEYMPAGQHTIVWNGTDSNNRPVASGIYIYTLHTTNRVQSKKMILLK